MKKSATITSSAHRFILRRWLEAQMFLLQCRMRFLEFRMFYHNMRIRFYFFTDGDKVPLYLRRRFAALQERNRHIKAFKNIHLPTITDGNESAIQK